MNREQALDLFSLNTLPEDPDDTRDILEESLFPLREYFLRQPIIPLLYQSRIRRVERLAEAAKVLGLELKEKPQAPSPPKLPTESLTALLREFEALVSHIRLEISQSFEPLVIIANAERLVIVEEAFEKVFLTLTADFASAESEVLSAQVLNTGKLLHAIAENEEGLIRELVGMERKRLESSIG